MSGYEDAQEVSFGEGALSTEQALARGRRALERAEMDLDAVERRLADADQLDDEMLLRITEERSYIGARWAELGAAMRRAER